jgi:glycosyltransferase involved in cell wall biosynthesis
LKILFVVHDYLPEHAGGTEVHTHALARELARRGHRVSVLFSERDLARAEGEVRRGELDGVRTIEVVHQREYADARETWLELRARKVFTAVLAEERPEVVHFQHLATWGAACLHVAREQGSAAVYTAHDFHLLCSNGRAMAPNQRLCLGATGNYRPDCAECVGNDRAAASERRRFHADMLRRAQRVICPSEFMAGVLRRNGFAKEEQIEVLAPGVAAAGRRARERGPMLRVGFVGGLFAAKGAHVLVDAMRLLADAPVELHVHGVLEWFPEYVAQLRSKAGERVVFHGRFAPDDAPRINESFDVLVSPSLWYENAPLAIAEAFRSGVPVVASKLGGMLEAVRDGVDGLLVPRDDPSALAAALRRLATEPGLLEGLASSIRPPPTLDAVATRVEQIYGECRA